MGKTYEFLKECKVFWVSTADRKTSIPKSRPFGAVMEYNGFLYVSTSTAKNVYKELKANLSIQITAIKPESREWIRVSGKALESQSVEEKKEMLKACPILEKRFSGPDDENFALFKIVDTESSLHNGSDIM